ncbi:MAG: transporter substrate-binding domain-containing protein [Magnetococcales bacterium]|nr:transporter substrate-binding domain-containing protein [Magnetococcales bacterium]
MKTRWLFSRRGGFAFGLLLWLGLCTAVPTGAAEPTIPLTPEEQAFLRGKTVRLGVDAGRPPFEFFDEQGHYAGICAGFVEALAKRLGLTVVPQKGMAWADAVEKAKAGEIDLIPKMTPTTERKKFFLFTQPYLTFPSVIVIRKEQFIEGIASLQGLRVAVVKGLVVEANLRRDYPDLTLVALPDMETALRTLATGQVDAFVDNLGAVSYTMDKLGLTNLKIAAPTPYKHDLALAVRKDWPLLVSALDKALASMSEEERSTIKSRWLAIQFQTGVDWRAVLLWGGPLAFALLVILLIMLLANRRLRREMGQRQEVERVLHNQAQLLEARSLAKTRLAELSAALQRAVSLEELAQTLFGTLAPLLGVGHGVFYQVDGEQLTCIGGYGHGERAIWARRVSIEDGLVGQCIVDQQPIVLTQLTEAYLPIVSGLGGGTPAMVLILPVLHLGQVLGVLELATFRPFTADQQAFLEDLLPLLATSLAILERSLRTQQLLAESLRQASQLAQRVGVSQ